MEGLLFKGIGGFYYVRCQESVYECRARGVFRKKGTVSYTHLTLPTILLV